LAGAPVGAFWLSPARLLDNWGEAAINPFVYE